MPKKRVFISFDFDNDRILKEFIIGQSLLADSPFDVTDTSLQEEAPQASWESKAEAKIKGSDMVVVMVGASTYRAPGVLKEVGFARKWGIPIFQIAGYKDSNPVPVPNAGSIYPWNWATLKQLFN